jgi:hypothetical protein
MSIEIIATPEFPASIPVTEAITSTEPQSVMPSEGTGVLPVSVVALTVGAFVYFGRKAVKSDRPWAESVKDFFVDK